MSLFFTFLYYYTNLAKKYKIIISLSKFFLVASNPLNYDYIDHKEHIKGKTFWLIYFFIKL